MVSKLRVLIENLNSEQSSELACWEWWCAVRKMGVERLEKGGGVELGDSTTFFIHASKKPGPHSTTSSRLQWSARVKQSTSFVWHSKSSGIILPLKYSVSQALLPRSPVISQAAEAWERQSEQGWLHPPVTCVYSNLVRKCNRSAAGSVTVFVSGLIIY